MARAENLARLFKYHRQFILKNVIPVQRERVGFATEYSGNRKTYETLLRIFDKYGIDAERFMAFCTGKLKITESRKLLDIRNFREYAIDLSISDQMRFVYSDFLRSAKNVARICVENGTTASEYLSGLVENNTLALEYYTGTFSKYYLAGIGNFKDIYMSLDSLGKEELEIVYEATDHLRETLIESFEAQGKKYVPPIALTDGIIRSLNIKS